MEVFFNGHGDWFIEDSNTQSSKISERVCHIEYNSYFGKYQECAYDDSACGLFILTKEDEKNTIKGHLRTITKI